MTRNERLKEPEDLVQVCIWTHTITFILQTLPHPPPNKRNTKDTSGRAGDIIRLYKSPLRKTDYTFLKKGSTIIEQK